MNISISAATKKLLNRQLKSGRYENADALVREALESLECEPIEDFDKETLADLKCAEAQSRREEGHSWESVKAEIQRRFLKQ